jgi:hypothetical protein
VEVEIEVRVNVKGHVEVYSMNSKSMSTYKSLNLF